MGTDGTRALQAMTGDAAWRENAAELAVTTYVVE